MPVYFSLTEREDFQTTLRLIPPLLSNAKREERGLGGEAIKSPQINGENGKNGVSTQTTLTPYKPKCLVET
jgi:hypothetical protein